MNCIIIGSYTIFFDNHHQWWHLCHIDSFHFDSHYMNQVKGWTKAIHKWFTSHEFWGYGYDYGYIVVIVDLYWNYWCSNAACILTFGVRLDSVILYPWDSWVGSRYIIRFRMWYGLKYNIYIVYLLYIYYIMYIYNYIYNLYNVYYIYIIF